MALGLSEPQSLCVLTTEERGGPLMLVEWRGDWGIGELGVGRFIVLSSLAVRIYLSFASLSFHFLCKTMTIAR